MCKALRIVPDTQEVLDKYLLNIGHIYIYSRALFLAHRKHSKKLAICQMLAIYIMIYSSSWLPLSPL